jgi:hypothetical protein
MRTANYTSVALYPGKVRVIRQIADFLTECANAEELTAQQRGRMQGCVTRLRKITSSRAPRITQELGCEMLRCLAYVPGRSFHPWISFLDEQ